MTPTSVFRAWGQDAGRPSGDADQSNARSRAPVSPPSIRNASWIGIGGTPSRAGGPAARAGHGTDFHTRRGRRHPPGIPLGGRGTAGHETPSPPRAGDPYKPRLAPGTMLVPEPLPNGSYFVKPRKSWLMKARSAPLVGVVRSMKSNTFPSCRP